MSDLASSTRVAGPGSEKAAAADESKKEMLIIEFVGGPFDGHQQSCLTSPHRLPTDVIWLVCEDGLRLLGGDEHQQRGVFTSVALYGLDGKNGTARYRFAGAISAMEFDDSLFNIE